MTHADHAIQHGEGRVTGTYEPASILSMLGSIAEPKAKPDPDRFICKSCPHLTFTSAKTLIEHVTKFRSDACG